MVMSVQTELGPNGALMVTVHDRRGRAQAEGIAQPAVEGRPAELSWWPNVESHRLDEEAGHDWAEALELLATEVGRQNAFAGHAGPNAARVERRVKASGALWLTVLDEEDRIVVVIEVERPEGDRRARTSWAPSLGVTSLSAEGLWLMERAFRDLRENMAALDAAHIAQQRSRARSS